MKDNKINISKGLASLIKKREPIQIKTDDEEKDEIETIYSTEEVHSFENIEDDFDDEDYLDEDEMGIEIESLIEKEKKPSFLDRINSIKEETKEEEKPIPVSVKIEQIKDSEDKKVKKSSLLDRFKEVKKAKDEEEKKTNFSETEDDSVSDEDLVEAFKTLEKFERVSFGE